MNKLLLAFLVIALICSSTLLVETKKIKKEKVSVEQKQAQEQVQQTEEQLLQAQQQAQAAKEAAEKVAAEEAEAKAQLVQEALARKEQERAAKEAAKLVKQEEKKKLQEQKIADKLAQQQAREAAKLVAQEEALLEQQRLLAAQAALACQPGTFKALSGECTPCSENCESCANTEFCNYCQIGFYRVVSDKKVAASCSATIPQGYLPQLSKFYKQNPEVLRSAEDYQGTAVALEGKKVITKEATTLPFSIVEGAPQVNGQKVRVDVVPCRTHCAECPEGFLSNPQTRGCVETSACVFPNEITGENTCQANDPTVFKGKIVIQEKTQKVQANPQFPAKRILNLQALINREDVIGISYQWTVSTADNQDVTPVVLAKTQFGSKVKADISSFQKDQVYTFNVQIKDSKVVDGTPLEISQEFTA